MNSAGAIVLLLVLIAIAGGLVFLWRRAERAADEQRQQRASGEEAVQQERSRRQELEQQIENQRNKNTELAKETAAAGAKLGAMQETEKKLTAAQEQLKTQQARIAELETKLENEQNNSAEKLQLLQKAEEQMRLRFEKLAQDILEEKSKKLSADSKAQLDPLLIPLKQNIDGFRRKIEDLHNENTKERTALKTHIEQLQQNASRISADADNLAKALKGSGKIQGDWGEQLLHKLLQNSGLVEGENYSLQPTHKTEDGSRQRPDAVIHLPDEKHLIIDAKVSLSDYINYCNTDDDNTRAAALKRHLQSVKQHINALYDRNYSGLTSLNSPDFVLMFMPLEPAYILALQEDSNLFTAAYDKKVVLTGPTTLMPVLRTVANIWRIEKQQRRAQDIAKQGGKLYDKFTGFIEDMDTLGRAMKKAQETYDKANNKLHQGRGNLVGQAEKLQEMGVEATKKLPQEILAQAQEDD